MPIRPIAHTLAWQHTLCWSRRLAIKALSLTLVRTREKLRAPFRNPAVLPARSHSRRRKTGKIKELTLSFEKKFLHALSPSSSSIDSNLLWVSLSFSPKEISVKAQVEALLDIGSLAGDFNLESGSDSELFSTELHFHVLGTN